MDEHVLGLILTKKMIFSYTYTQVQIEDLKNVILEKQDLLMEASEALDEMDMNNEQETIEEALNNFGIEHLQVPIRLLQIIFYRLKKCRQGMFVLKCNFQKAYDLLKSFIPATDSPVTSWPLIGLKY